MDNVIGLPSKKDDQAVALAELRKNLKFMIEMQPMMAYLRKASYDAHIKEGFTPEQALIIAIKF